MEIGIPLLLSSIAGLSTLLGTIFIFFKIKKVEEFISFSLAFSFIIILSISIFDLLLDSIINIINFKGVFGLILAFLVFILGNNSIKAINSKIKSKNDSNLYRVGILSMISLLLHNIPEGVAVFMSTLSNVNVGLKLCLAIMLHNIPEGILISVPLYHSGVKKSKVILLTLLSGIIEPAGGVVGYLLFSSFINDVVLSYILIFVSGLMINLAVNDIYKEMISYNKYKYIVSGVIVGVLFFIGLMLI